MKFLKPWDYRQPDFYKFDKDSLWIAKEAQKILKDNMYILDLFCGCGVIGIELWQHHKNIKLSLLELQDDFLPYIKENISHFEDLIVDDIFMGNFKEIKLKNKFDLIVTNPPYFSLENSRISPNKNKALCRHRCGFDLSQMITFFNDNSNSNGKMIFTARELPKIEGVEVLGQRGKTYLLQYRRLYIDRD